MNLESIKKYFDDKGKVSPDKRAGDKDQAAVTNNVDIKITIDKSGQSNSQSKTDSNSSDQNDKSNASKMGDLIRGEVLKVLNKELRPQGLLKESIKRN